MIAWFFMPMMYWWLPRGQPQMGEELTTEIGTQE
jgi:hypothetical protein